MSEIRKAFYKAAQRPEEPQDILDVILQERPDLRQEKPLCINTGSYGYAFIFNNEVFKAPKDRCYDDDEITGDFQAEIKIQQALAAQEFPVPQITYTGKSAFFFGMKKAEGLSLKDALSGVYVKLSEQQRHNIITGIAQFKARLEKVDLGLSLSPEDVFALPEKKLLWAREGLSSPVMQECLREKAPDFLAALQKTLDDYPSRQAGIVHGDLHGGNILFDPRTGEISAFIDFGRVKRTIVPDAEFLHLQQSYDPDFALAVQEAYQAITGREVQTGSYLCLKALDKLAESMALAKTQSEDRARETLNVAAKFLTSKLYYGAYRAAKGMTP